MPSHTYPQYPYTQQPTNWPVIILGILGIIILIGIIWYFVVNPLFQVSEEVNNLLNETQGQETIYDCSSDVYNCGNFTTQAEAQAVFDACGTGDIHQLDADGNGEACESLQ